RQEIAANPYPLYHRLRSGDPVRWDAPLGAWVVTCYADVQSALGDARLSAERINLSTEWLPEAMRETLGPVFRALSRQMLFLDPPDHTRLRGLVNKAFTPRVVEGMRPHIQAIVDDLLDAVQEAGRMDVIQDFAYPLPAIVIAEMLGVPPEDRDQFRIWSDDFGALIGRSDLTLDGATRALRGVAEFMDYFRNIVAWRRASPRDDLLQSLIAAEDRGDALSEEELLANCVLLLAAGHGTTTHLIGNGLLALLRNPDQLRKLRDDPTLIAAAVTELLRYDSPVQATGRVAAQELPIGARRVGVGEGLILCLGAANRDPEQFPDPDRLDIGRRENRPIAFGHGIHFCLGAPLARIEAQIAFATLLRRLPGLHLGTEVLEWEPSLSFRGLARLPVAFAT
ncbi:MAG TPA: cytochrome P450, partial [Chloroflexota bacterium]|nr:cytochrome P450 [Chloroflexota bacterium]